MAKKIEIRNSTAEFLIFQEDGGGRREGRGCMSRRKGISAGSGDEELDIHISKGPRPLDDGLDDLIVEDGDESQRE